MTRIESSPKIVPSQSHGTLKRVFKIIVHVVSLPFKLSLKGIVFIILLGLFVIILLTGVWQVPIASSIIYHEPKPVRDVKSSIFSETLFTLQTERKISDSASGTVRVDLTENQLTALFQDTLVQKELYPFVFSQLVVVSDYIEFYGRLKSRPQVIVRAHLIPYVEEDDLRIRIDRIFVGQLRIPRVLTPSSIAGAFTPSLVSGILAVSSVEAVELSQGHLILTLSPL
ncbi:MAG: hypothetical protein WC495_00180 [Patescibacteria group bacterium]|jgi:hypothetical protein